MTRHFRQLPSVYSPSGWGQPSSRSRRVTWRWSRIRVTSFGSPRRRPKRFQPPPFRDRRFPMPMIDVYATEGTFNDKHMLAQDLAKAVMRWEKVPQIPLFLDNTAAFIHDLPADAIANAAGDSNYVRVQVLTPINVLDRDKQLGVVKELAEIVVAAAGDPSLPTAPGCNFSDCAPMERHR